MSRAARSIPPKEILSVKRFLSSCARLPRVVFSFGIAAVLTSLAVPAHAVTIDWVTVGDPGNAADTAPAGFGAVSTSFQIMKYEFTNQQYTEFLNSVDASGTNPNSVYNADMGNSASNRGGISFTSGAASGSKYAVRTNFGNKPVNWVNWFDAARVSNWLMNGATGTSSTETGAYTLNNETSGNAPAVNPGATIYIPTENEWYKAAYYKGGSTNAGYWNYATRSNTAPTKVTATTVGTGTSGGVSPVTTGNFANFSQGANWNSQPGNVTTVGTNGGASAYGAFDMSGNLLEWNDLTGAVGSSRGLRGGDWFNVSAGNLSSSDGFTTDPALDNFGYIGFRLASPVAVPEPSTYAMALAGLACGGFVVFRRRRAR
ncbi:MAG: PEP-CTERM sorting domain-containing protein [Planctomycetota bacterium]|nr:MAG: PEP-CTERM sorting domain-containing protein [Planctomycetota bacterium]